MLLSPLSGAPTHTQTFRFRNANAGTYSSITLEAYLGSGLGARPEDPNSLRSAYVVARLIPTDPPPSAVAPLTPTSARAGLANAAPSLPPGVSMLATEGSYPAVTMSTGSATRYPQAMSPTSANRYPATAAGPSRGPSAYGGPPPRDPRMGYGGSRYQR